MPIGSRILITETWCDLKVLIDSSNHKELFVLLWGLWERIKLTRMETGWDEEISRSFWTRYCEDRGLDIEKITGREPIPRIIEELGSEHDIIERS